MRSSDLKVVLGLMVLGLACLIPLLVPYEGDWIPAYDSKLLAVLSKLLLIIALLSSVWWVNRECMKCGGDPGLWRATFLMMFLALLLVGVHWLTRDRHPDVREWQRDVYLDIVPTAPRDDIIIPHAYRPLPYGLVRGFEWITGDWYFSCLLYRWFFTFAFLWGWYRLARCYLGVRASIFSVLPILILYPYSIATYDGQLTDPLSHFLFTLSLHFVVRDRFAPLFMATVLGMVAKETAVLIVPVYFLCHWRRWPSAWLKTTGLGLACIAAFVATRTPHGWQPGIKLTDVGLMFGPNLGFDDGGVISDLPLWQRYAHWIGFLAPFVLILLWKRPRLPLKLLTIVVVFTPLVLFCNLAFGWADESRNYLPAIPPLSIAVMLSLFPRSQEGRSDVDL